MGDGRVGDGRAGPDGTLLRLSEVLGRRVRTSAGADAGRLADLSVRLGPEHPRVVRALVRARGAPGVLVAADSLDLAGPQVRARPGADLPASADGHLPLPLAPDELLLGRDVLDTQVVDLHGRRLSRVSDVLLRATYSGLEVVGVDLGAAGLLRRLGLGRLGAWAGVLEVDWPHLHLTSPRGHLVQLGTDTAPFRQLDAPGLAELLARLSTPRAVDVVRATEPARAAAALHHSHPRTGRRIVQGLTGAEQQGLAADAADEHARTVRRLGRRVSPVARRRWRRTEGWRLQRPPGGGR